MHTKKKNLITETIQTLIHFYRSPELKDVFFRKYISNSEMIGLRQKKILFISH